MEIEWGQSRGGVVEKVFVRGPPPCKYSVILTHMALKAMCIITYNCK